MSDWDDLFAAAAGEVVASVPAVDEAETGINLSTSSTSSSTTPPSPPPPFMHKKKKRKKDKREGAATNYDKKRKDIDTNTRTSEADLFHTFLRSRINRVEEQVVDFPHWFHLGRSLCTKRSSSLFCSGYKKCNPSRASSTSSSSSSSSIDACEQCSLSPLYHSSEINIETMKNNDRSFLHSFALIRDIRCCCSCIFEIVAQSAASVEGNTMERQRKHDIEELLCNEKKEQVIELVKTAKYYAKELLGSTTNLLPTGEREILEMKFQAISRCCAILYSNMKRLLCKKITQQFKNNTVRKKKAKDNESSINTFWGGIFDELLNLMIKCDAAYYRLYYLQVAGCLPVLEDHQCEDVIHIPHPPNYFGTNNFTWNVSRGKDWKKDIVNKVRHSLGDIDAFNNMKRGKWRAILNPLGLTYNDHTIESLREGPVSRKQDPLSFMHENRFMEGLLVFWSSGWINSNQAENALSSVQNEKRSSPKGDHQQKFYEQHETIAPQILADWRDSCRDLLCNLYGYATIAPSTLLRIKNDLQNLDSVNNVVEMGAGTGYLAHLFDEEGLGITAFDVAPTVPLKCSNVMINEYHGLTQPFFDVKKGDEKQLRSFLKNQKHAHTTALLLCYPPPLSSMAEDMLSTFKSFGGRCVIHVGEFSGLTGSSKFQHLLQRDFKLVSRYDCLQWGTDSTEATIWWKDDKKGGNKSSVLIPCSCCKKMEAKKRCRLSRSLRYCSVECFQDHTAERRIRLALNNVPLCSCNGQRSDLSYDHPTHFSRILD